MIEQIALNIARLPLAGLLSSVLLNAMQRQSLGSPSSKLQIHGGCGSGGGAPQREEQWKSGSLPAVEPASAISPADIKPEKPIRPISKTYRSIHIVPVLILLCFLILYLCSHEPSPADLASFTGFSSIVNDKGVSWKEMRRFPAAEKGGVTGLRSHRALKEAGRIRRWKMGPP